jgi:predicted  nucleic acid-binding Zn-ribbon protein
MTDLFNNEIISLLALFTTLLATLVLILVGRKALISSKEARLSALDELIKDRKARLGDKGKLEVEVETLTKKQDQLQILTQALQNDLEPLKSKHADAVLEYEKQKEKLRTLREEWRQLQDKVELYEKKIKKLNELEEEIKGLGEQRDALKAEVDSLPKVKEELEKVGADLKQAQESKQKLEEEITQVESDKKKRSEDLKELEALFAERTERLSELGDQIVQKEDELKKKEQALHDTTVKLDARRSELTTIGRIPEEAFESLRTPWIKTIPQLLQTADEMQALDQLGRLLEDHEYKFSKRLLYAFHTALKTSDISCLTVMAGVSGTGKSLLPRLYAQVMGIHFLSLSVEPRWDSPQDLFGFLNYMENRYEATALGRALVQFNNSPHKDSSYSKSMDNQVLLVLLDEMNLARVEYYFSEFLSKLEMRRDADIRRLENYNNISVEVYAGHDEDNEKGVKACAAIRLFAGQNILFVGTMNEDESTQSLSDKVIDRANVLHFGRPDQMSCAEQRIITTTEPKFMSFNAWKSWVRKPDRTTIPDLHDMEAKLNEINAILSDLGRPFGHRTFKAILSYIANYPINENSMRPLADQVAMRVMPKLRGLDLGEHAEAFNRFNNMLAQINDPVLTRAFEDARNNAMGFFSWRGLNWDS